MHPNTKEKSKELMKSFPKEEQKEIEASEKSTLLSPIVFSPNSEQETDEIFRMIQDIQKITENCTSLNNKQKWDYCKSQREYIKQFLKKLNKNKE